jgi:hypothetical protein
MVMCDYSEQLARRFCRRPAMVGDELELITFAGVRCFAKLWRNKRWLPTCLRPGTEIVFSHRQVLSQCRSFVECDNGERILVNDIMPKEARFAMVPGGLQRARDGLEFSNGLQCGLSAIGLGTRIRVLQLPAVRHRRRRQQQSAAAPLTPVRELVPVPR